MTQYGTTPARANEVVIKDLIEICCDATPMQTVKETLRSTNFSTPGEVLQTFLSTTFDD